MNLRFSSGSLRPGLLLVAGLALLGDSLERPAEVNSPATEAFTEVTEQAGITWRHINGESPDRYLIEAMGGGVAFLDFDGDGLLDLLFVNGGETPHAKSSIPIR